ncbi:MAG: flagellar hook-associated protein FlgK [Alphaproteobacteria bacterium]
MSLDNALSNSLTGLKAAQQLISTASGNISNYKTDNYVKRVAELSPQNITGGQGNGVMVAAITRQVDQYLSETLRSQTSLVSENTVIDTYNKEIQLLFGTPGTKSTLDSNINEFFSSLKALSNSPDLEALRFETVNKARNLADNISNLSQNLHQLRYNADRDISSSVSEVNNHLADLRNINAAINTTDKSTEAYANLMQKRDDALKVLSEKLNINVYYKSNGEISINTSGGAPLLDSNLYEMEYIQAASIEAFTKNSTLGSLKVNSLDLSGNILDSFDIISSGIGNFGGTPSTITSLIKSGEIAALQELRDVSIPNIIDQLDNLAAKISSEFNKIHNSGSGFPPLSTMLSTRPVYAEDVRAFSGNVRIGLVDKSGDPIKKNDGSDLNPLNLNLSNMKSGSISGQISVQTIIDEINQYFYNEAVEAHTSIGNIYDVKLAAASPLSTAPNGQFTFNFALENQSQTDSTFEVLSINVTDAGCAGLVGGLPSPYVSEAGVRDRTTTPITVDFAGGSGGPYTIQAQVKITEADGTISTSTINYSIDDNPSNINIQNQRYTASTIASGSALIIPSGSVKQFAHAELVNSNGDPVSGNEPGYLKIKTLHENCYIAIDDLNSKENGYPATLVRDAIPATSKGFSEYFELNDFFVRNSDYDLTTGDSNLAGTALNLQIRKDIASNPHLISLGKLTQSQPYAKSETIGETHASGNFRFSNNPSVGDTITINGVDFTYVALASANDEITLGGTLADTLDNTIGKLNAVNAVTSGIVDQATYTNNNADTLIINYNAPGTKGNNFSLSGNFTTISASINDSSFSVTPNGKLENGTDDEVTKFITPWSYGIGRGNNSSIIELANLSSASFNFDSAGGISKSYSSFIGYTSTIITYNATQANIATHNLDTQKILYDAYNEKFLAESGVNIDEELMNITQYQMYYSASAKVITVTKELYQELLSTFR